ncbi:nitrogen fixation protein NifZ [Rhodoferax sp.]|uniref:nitrogen fixation protein NifZ n=1 Tax=Rhodoferax sp. TaxID=50421 RepID=UPI0025CE3218|nr:nitrogen fixation protein NifZ [Rhodoferax sp.]MCM2342393.1 nitrogen fixation protein NifZ [Rhodoferax sp.]
MNITANALPGLEPRAPAYAWGQRVIALDDLVNDGSYPDRPVDALLAARGSVGEVVNVGHAPELNEPVYLVQFDGCVVGCLEIELVPAPPGLLPETGD